MAKGRFKSLSVTVEVYEKLKRIAEKRGFATLADAVAYLVAIEEEVLSRLEKVLGMSGKTIQVYETDDLPEEVRGRQPLECARGEGIEVCVYDVP
jgi:hypothetical protein